MIILTIRTPKSALDETLALITLGDSLLSQSARAAIKHIITNTNDTTTAKDAWRIYIPVQHSISLYKLSTRRLGSSSEGTHFKKQQKSSRKLRKNTVTSREQTDRSSLRGHTYLNLFCWKLQETQMMSRITRITSRIPQQKITVKVVQST